MPPSSGTKRAPRSTSAGATSVGSGCSGRNVEPSAETPSRVTRLNSVAEPAVGVLQVLDAALLDRVAGRLRQPQLDVDAPERRDRPPRAGGIDERGRPRAGGDDDRAARASVPLAVRTPVARPSSMTGVAATPSISSAPAARARAAKAWVAAAGGTGRPVSSRKAASPSASAGSAACSVAGSSASARSSGKRAARSARVGSSAAASSETTSTPTASAGSSKPWPSSSYSAAEAA